MLGLDTLPAPWNWIAAALLLGVAGLLIGGFFLHPYDDLRQGRMPKRAQLPQSVLLIALAAIIWLSAGRETPLATLALLTVIGMALGFLGDLFMANVFDQAQHVLFGMGAFAAGHVFYMLGFRAIALHLTLHQTGAYLIGLLVTWVIALVIWLIMIRNPEGDFMQYAALGYALFLASMAGYAVGLALQNSAFWPLAVGAILFLLSDALIAARLFGGISSRYLGDVIWTTYIIAQALIVTAVPVALGL